MAARKASWFGFGKKKGSRDSRDSGASSQSSSGEVDGLSGPNSGKAAEPATQPQEPADGGTAAGAPGTDATQRTLSDEQQRVQPFPAATRQPAGGGGGAADLPPVNLKVRVAHPQQAGGGEPAPVAREPTGGRDSHVASSTDTLSTASAALQPGRLDAPGGVSGRPDIPRSDSGGSSGGPSMGWKTPPRAPLLLDPNVGEYPAIQCPKMHEWQKGEKIGSGGFGSVYKCINIMTGEFFAVKQVPRNLSDSGTRAVQSMEQLKQEVMVLSRLRHPNIVQYIGSDMDDENLYIFLEFLECGSIQKVMQKFPDFSEDLIRSYTRQILLGLDFLHENGTVHRDIKGSNILVSTQGRVKLADFGVSRHFGEDIDMTSCRGTVWWMAPEAINCAGYGWQVDIWSLGCTVIEMVTRVPPWLDPETGKPPWGDADQILALWSIGRAKHPPPIPEKISPVMHDFISQCLQIDPSLRPSAKQLLLHPFVSPKGLLQQSRSGSGGGGGGGAAPLEPAPPPPPVSMLRGLGAVQSTVNAAISSMAKATSPASPRPPGLPLRSSASGSGGPSGDLGASAGPSAFDGATSLSSNAEDTSAPPSPVLWRRPKDTDGRSSSGRSDKDRFSPESNRGPHVYPVPGGPHGGYLPAQGPGSERGVGGYDGNVGYGQRPAVVGHLDHLHYGSFPPPYSYGGEGVTGVYGGLPYEAGGDVYSSHFMARQGYHHHPRDVPEGGSYPPASLRAMSRAGTPGTPPSPPRYPLDPPPPAAYPSYMPPAPPYHGSGPYPAYPEEDEGGGYRDHDESERRRGPSSLVYDPTAYHSYRSSYDTRSIAMAPPMSARSSRGTPSHSPHRSPVHDSLEASAFPSHLSPARAAAAGGSGSLRAHAGARRTRSQIPSEFFSASIDDFHGGGGAYGGGSGYPPPGTRSPGGGYSGGVPVRSNSVGPAGSLLQPGGGGGRYDQPVVLVPPRQPMKFSPSPRSNSPLVSPDGPLDDFPNEGGKSEWELFKERQRAQASEVAAGGGAGGTGSRTPGGGRAHGRSPLASPRSGEWGAGSLPLGSALQLGGGPDLGGSSGSSYRASAYGGSLVAYGGAVEGTRSPSRGVYGARVQERAGAFAPQPTQQQRGAAIQGEELIEQLNKLHMTQRSGSIER